MSETQSLLDVALALSVWVNTAEIAFVKEGENIF